jgi:hypothetical protein
MQIDDYELVRLGEIFEKEYYGYVSDMELIQAMNTLLNTFDIPQLKEIDSDSQMLTETSGSILSIQSNQGNQSQNDDSDEYY